MLCPFRPDLRTVTRKHREQSNDDPNASNRPERRRGQTDISCGLPAYLDARHLIRPPTPAVDMDQGAWLGEAQDRVGGGSPAQMERPECQAIPSGKMARDIEELASRRGVHRKSSRQKSRRRIDPSG